MTLYLILLIGAALLPAVALGIYVFCKDRVEKEPAGLLFLLLLAGVAICFPAAELEGVLFDAIHSIFAPFAVVKEDGSLGLISSLYKIYIACENFIGVALVEEGLKFLVLFLITHKSKHFNSLFDGLIYAVFVSIGFAAFENVLYVLNNGFMNALMRGILSVPGHVFYGVFMGYYYSMWHMRVLAKKKEKAMKLQGIIPQSAPEFSGASQLALALIVPVLGHGLYDYCCSIGSVLAMFGLLAFMLILYIYCFAKIKGMSKQDCSDQLYVLYLLLKKYPHLASQVMQICGVAPKA